MHNNYLITHTSTLAHFFKHQEDTISSDKNHPFYHKTINSTTTQKQKIQNKITNEAKNVASLNLNNLSNL